jgi:hypothetical protein
MCLDCSTLLVALAATWFGPFTMLEWGIRGGSLSEADVLTAPAIHAMCIDPQQIARPDHLIGVSQQR